jgi:hypothetical protein
MQNYFWWFRDRVVRISGVQAVSEQEKTLEAERVTGVQQSRARPVWSAAFPHSGGGSN